MEYVDSTEEKRTAAILEALDKSQVRADFSAEGDLIWLNDRIRAAIDVDGIPQTTLAELITTEDGGAIWDDAAKGTPIAGKMRLAHEGRDIVVDGSINPMRNRSGQLSGFFLLGNDITKAASHLKEANRKNAELTAAQQHPD